MPVERRDVRQGGLILRQPDRARDRLQMPRRIARVEAGGEDALVEEAK
jgi:hypothetical protein